jgi:AraC-type DNA-binding domain-containing proteins
VSTIQAAGDIPTRFRWKGPGLLLPDEPCNFAVVLNTRSATFPEHEGYLSLKFVLRGRERFTQDGRSVSVDDRHYLVLNHGQRYASEVWDHTPAECVAVFFDPVFASDVLLTLATPLDRILHLPAVTHQPVHFFDRLYEIDPLLSARLTHLRERLSSGRTDAISLSACFTAMLEQLLHVHRGLRPEIDSIDATKPSTRIELYRRLSWGRDYLDSCFDESISVTHAAGAACLSRYQFQRLFQQAFGMTPHGYLTERRLREARRLLKETDEPVTSICMRVGFESLGSFTTLFRRRHGLPPGAWRRSFRPPQ